MSVESPVTLMATLVKASFSDVKDRISSKVTNAVSHIWNTSSGTKERVAVGAGAAYAYSQAGFAGAAAVVASYIWGKIHQVTTVIYQDKAIIEKPKGTPSKLTPDAFFKDVKALPKLKAYKEESSILQALNELKIDEDFLYRLPKAIAARCNQESLINAEIKLRIPPAIKKIGGKEPLSRKDLIDLKELLQKIEMDKFPPYLKHDCARVLLSLLEIYSFVSTCIKKGSASGLQILELRKTLGRIDPLFHKNGDKKLEKRSALSILEKIVPPLEA